MLHSHSYLHPVSIPYQVWECRLGPGLKHRVKDSFLQWQLKGEEGIETFGLRLKNAELAQQVGSLPSSPPPSSLSILLFFHSPSLPPFSLPPSPQLSDVMTVAITSAAFKHARKTSLNVRALPPPSCMLSVAPAPHPPTA